MGDSLLSPTGTKCRPSTAMPILQAECSLHPDDLLEATSGNGSWWAMYTLSRQEKTLMRQLRDREISYYCPVVPHSYRSPAGRQRVSYLPLFSNYVFVHGDEEARFQAVSTGCVSRHLAVADGNVFQQQLRDLQRVIAAGRPIALESRLPVGARIRIKSGPLLGMTGVITHRRSERRFVISLNFLQQGASVCLEDWEIERV